MYDNANNIAEGAGMLVYYVVVATLMFAFPLVSVGVEAKTASAAIDAALIG